MTAREERDQQPPGPVGKSSESTQILEKKIDDLKDLDISPSPKRLQEQRGRVVSVNNNRKREAEGEPGSPDPPVGSNSVDPMAGRPHHGKTRSTGRNADFVHLAGSPSDSDYRRGSAHTKQPLFDPNISATNAAKAPRRDKQQSHPHALGRFQTPKGLFQSKHLQSLNVKDEVKPDPDMEYAASYPEPLFNHGLEEQSDRPLSPLKDREDHSSVSPPAEERPTTLEVEPELLLQPETRPISHEQLVVEVKGIYAGLVMVEAKCIDIDERQSAAAQEKEPSKRFDLKNDQWQSLIALHKQVRIVPSPSLTDLLRMTKSDLVCSQVAPRTS